jgi:P-type conjugative transfer protein TrbJ
MRTFPSAVLAVIVFLVSLLPATGAYAQWAVIDAPNLAQNLRSAINSVQQINNQLRQLENEAQMLGNDQRQLTSLNFSALAELQQRLAQTQRWLQQTGGMPFSVADIDQRFAELYPELYGAGVSFTRMTADAGNRRENARRAILTALRLQAQAAQNMDGDQSTLTALVGRSQGAIGQLQAAQTTNQLLALQSRQAMQEQQLRIAQDRSAAAEQARMLAAEVQGREVQRRFLSNGTRYTPVAVDFYNY